MEINEANKLLHCCTSAKAIIHAQCDVTVMTAAMQLPYGGQYGVIFRPAVNGIDGLEDTEIISTDVLI